MVRGWEINYCPKDTNAEVVVQSGNKKCYDDLAPTGEEGDEAQTNYVSGTRIYYNDDDPVC